MEKESKGPVWKLHNWFLSKARHIEQDLSDIGPIIGFNISTVYAIIVHGHVIYYKITC